MVAILLYEHKRISEIETEMEYIRKVRDNLKLSIEHVLGDKHFKTVWHVAS